MGRRPPTERPRWPVRAAKAVADFIGEVLDEMDDEEVARQQRRTAPAATLRVPAEVLGQFRANRPELSDQDAGLVVEALGQWVRIERREPGHVLPSHAVHELQRLRGGPDPAPPLFVAAPAVHYPESPSQAASDLQHTFLDAFIDERPLVLPLLFRVDEAVRWPGGLCYRDTCVTWPCPTLTEDGRVCVHFKWGKADSGDSFMHFWAGGMGDGG